MNFVGSYFCRVPFRTFPDTSSHFAPKALPTKFTLRNFGFLSASLSACGSLGATRDMPETLMTINLSAPAREPGAPWTIGHAARHLQISDRHLRRLIEENKVRAIRLGRRVLLTDAEVRRLATEGT